MALNYFYILILNFNSHSDFSPPLPLCAVAQTHQNFPKTQMSNTPSANQGKNQFTDFKGNPSLPSPNCVQPALRSTGH
jgi:hypothetical protein